MVCFWLAAASFMAARGSLLTAEGDEPRPIKAAPRIMRTANPLLGPGSRVFCVLESKPLLIPSPNMGLVRGRRDTSPAASLVLPAGLAKLATTPTYAPA